MRTKFTFLLVFLTVTVLTKAQQVPNGGMETWTSPKAPNGWATLDSVISLLGHSGLVDKDTADKFTGSASAKLTSTYIGLAQDTIPGILSLGSGSFDGQQPHWVGIPFAFRPDTVFFAYKYAPVAGDTATIQLQVHLASGGFALDGGFTLAGTAGQWLYGGIPLTHYYTDSTHAVDTLLVQFYSTIHGGGGSHPRVGSVLHVDAISFGYKSAPNLIEEIDNSLTTAVFPNPAKDVVNIQVSEAPANASVMVFDLNGRVVTHQLFSGTNYQLYTGNWANGIYTYSIISNNVAVSKGKFVIAK